MLGITLEGAKGLGDALQFSSFPENFYRNTGEKVIDLDESWCFDHNPYVVRGVEPSLSLNLWTRKCSSEQSGVLIERFQWKPTWSSIAERTTALFNHTAFLRHPRLYRYEDLGPLDRSVVVHTTGSPGAPVRISQGEDSRRVLSEEVISFIRGKYRGYDVCQIGASVDVDAGVTDCRDIGDIWETVRIIARARIFIGVDSGPSWIAACYPSIDNKKVLMQYPPAYLRNSFAPMHLLKPHEQWHDNSFKYFNRTGDDAGITYSYKKL